MSSKESKLRKQINGHQVANIETEVRGFAEAIRATKLDGFGEHNDIPAVMAWAENATNVRPEVLCAIIAATYNTTVELIATAADNTTSELEH